MTATPPLRLEHPSGTVTVLRHADGTADVRAELTDPDVFSPCLEWRTDFPDAVLEAVLAAKGPAYLCDELRRESEPRYVQHALAHAILGYVPREAFADRRVLDFGSGSGASTICLHRLLEPKEIVGVELVEEYVEAARAIAGFRGLSDRVTFHRSPDPSRLPEGLGNFDYIVMSANYEHLLPDERPHLLRLLFGQLAPGGVLFLNQTPHRWFPIEAHTTGLPLVNYLPDAVVARVARLSARIPDDDDWPTLLRKGIRGGTLTEITRLLRNAGFEPEVLEPLEGDRVDLWLKISGGTRLGAPKRALAGVLKMGKALTGHVLAPQLTLALRKGGS